MWIINQLSADTLLINKRITDAWVVQVCVAGLGMYTLIYKLQLFSCLAGYGW